LKCGYSYLQIISPPTAALPLKIEKAEDPSDDYNIDNIVYRFIDLNLEASIVNWISSDMSS
jgi:hypothetical protein